MADQERHLGPWKGVRQQALDVLSIPAMSEEIERLLDSTIEYLETSTILVDPKYRHTIQQFYTMLCHKNLCKTERTPETKIISEPYSSG